jgi:hypothetical protein
MKKLFAITAALLLSSSLTFSQELETEINTEPVTEQAVTPEAATHGQTVSALAKEGESGEVISQQARTMGESKRAEKMEKRDQKKQNAQAQRAQRANKPENVRPERAERPDRPMRPERPTRPERPARPETPGRP